MSLQTNQTQELELELSFNEKQGDFLEKCMFGFPVGKTKTAGLLGGRGGGKSVAEAALLRIMANELPKAKGQFACVTTTQAKRSLTPGLKAEWFNDDRWGLRTYNWDTGEGDVVFWRQPPTDWDRPYQEPDDWKNCISFANGFVIELCAYKLDPDTHRGRNDDFLIIDEALLFKQEWLKIAQPCVRANTNKFESSLHWLFAFFSSPPYGSDGAWMYSYEKLAKQDPAKYYFQFITTRDNQINLPEDYIDNLRNSLLKVQFEVEVEGKRIVRPPATFYPKFSRDKHCPPLEDDEVFYSPFADIELSLDFNAHFTSCSEWQPKDRELRQIGETFVKTPDDDFNMTQTLALRVREKYKKHKKKRMLITGDRNGKNGSAQAKFKDGKLQNMFDEFAEIMEEDGWEMIIAPLNYNPEGMEKHQIIDKILGENSKAEYYIRMNPNNCQCTIISVESAPIHSDYSKNKKSETSGGDQELATHLSDTLDYYLIFKKKQGFGSSHSGFDIVEL